MPASPPRARDGAADLCPHIPPCAALLDHATATLTSERALRMRYTAHDVQTRLESILDEVTDLVARTGQQSS